MVRKNRHRMFRKLTEAEIIRLSDNNNRADNWDDVLVVGSFFVDGVRNCRFSGRNYIGENCIVENASEIRNCRIGNDCVIRNVGEIVADRASDYAVRVNLCNEHPRYPVTLVPGMNTTDVFTALYSSLHGMFADGLQTSEFVTIGDNAVVKNVMSVRNSFIGSGSVVSEAVSVADSWIAPSEGRSRSTVGAGAVINSVILHKGSSITANSMVCSALIGENCEISQGARVCESVIGDCSHISGCEIGNSFIYPFHSQHHSSSFLIAGHVRGQSNIAAGDILGSNHNGRSNDGEFEAGRGFWAGLCSSITMPSRFAPFTLLVKGDYHYPLNVDLAFSLVANNVHENTLDILPAYWWLHNAYSLFRNELKFKSRDKRENPTQDVDCETLAPDTMQAVVRSHKLLKGILTDPSIADSLELSNRKVRILKPEEGLHAYESMILCYLFQVFGMELYDSRKMDAMLREVHGECPVFVNAGGQILPSDLLDKLCDAKSGQLEKNHRLQSEYCKNKRDDYIRKSALWALRYFIEESVCFADTLRNGKTDWKRVAEEAVAHTLSYYEMVVAKRLKDAESPFRHLVNADFGGKRCNELAGDTTVEAARNMIENLKKMIER